MSVTRECIENDINNPEALEVLYLKDKRSFSEIIEKMHDEGTGVIAVNFWYARLFQGKSEHKRNHSYKQYVIIIFLIVLSWLPVKVFTLDVVANKDLIIRIIPITISLALSVYFIRNAFTFKKVLITFLLHFVLAIYYMALPVNKESQSIANALYFGLILLWFLNWISYTSYRASEIMHISEFVLITGETIIWSTLFSLGGAVLVFLSINLFDTIGIDADKFYVNNIVTLGLCAAPFVSLAVMDIFDRFRISSILSKVFLPLFLVSIVVFAIVSIFTNTKPYEARDVFIIYNIMLVIVICLLNFVSVNSTGFRFIKISSMFLAIFTIALDIIVLSAIVYRIKNYGVTPNKITLLAANITMLGNLIYIVFIGKKYNEHKEYTKRILHYLPAYAILAITIVFIFPAIFGYK